MHSWLGFKVVILFFVCEQELGKRRPRPTHTTLSTAGQLVSRPSDLPPIKSAFMSTASEGFETAGIGLEVPRGGKPAPRRQTALRALPRPFIFMAYFSAFVLGCMAITLAVVYGTMFQSATSTAWGIATVTSIIFEYVLVEPVWLMITAFIQVRIHLLKTVEDELTGNRVHHHDDAPDAARAQESVNDSQQNNMAEPGFNSLEAVLEGDAVDSIELPAFDIIPGNLEDILADRIESFVSGLRAPNANSTYNFVRDVDESEFRRACAACGLNMNDERITDLWGNCELDDRGRAQVRAIIDMLTLNDLDKHIATLFLRMDVVDEAVRGEEVQRSLGGFMDDQQVEQVAPEGSALLTFGELRSRFNALLEVEEHVHMEIEEDKEDLLRMLETQLSTALSRMDARGARRQVLLPKQRPYVVSNVADLDEIQLTGPDGQSEQRE